MSKKKILGVFLFVFLLASCTSYTPNLWTGYDILNPNEEVKKNPLGFTEDGNVIVNQAFIIYVYELKQEIIKLRKKSGG